MDYIFIKLLLKWQVCIIVCLTEAQRMTELNGEVFEYVDTKNGEERTSIKEPLLDLKKIILTCNYLQESAQTLSVG